MQPQELSTPPTAPSKKRTRLILRVLLCLLLFVCLLLGVFWWMLTSPPSYWRVVDGADPAVQRRAAGVESLVSTQTTLVRPADETWTMELSTAQVNDWLGSRLPMWLANQGVDRAIIDALPRAVVSTGEGRIELAVQAKLGGVTQIVRGVYVIESGDPARLKLHGLYAGRVPLPLDTIVARVSAATGRASPAEVRRWIESVKLQLPLGDRRVVRVVDIKLSDEGAILTCVTGKR